MTELADRLAVMERAFPPPTGVSGANWGAVEAHLGLRLPASYKALCDVYADSLIDRRGEQIELIAPQASRKGKRFPAVALAETASLRQQRRMQLENPDFTPVPDLRQWRFFPEEGGLLPWGWKGALLMFFEVDLAAAPDRWRIVAPVTQRRGAINVVDLAVVAETDAAAFLVRLLDPGSASPISATAPANRGRSTAPEAGDEPQPLSVDESWALIEEVLASDYPEAHAGLRDGADEAALAAVEAELGARLPESYRRSALRHDGQHPRAPWLVEGGLLCSLEDMMHDWRVWTGMQDAGELDGFEVDAEPDAGVRDDRWWRRGWLPFVSQDGDHLVLDLDPAPQGRVGQVFAFSHETGPGRLAAPDFGAWLQVWADELRAGIVMPRDSPYVDENDTDDDDDDWSTDEDEDDSRTWPRQ